MCVSRERGRENIYIYMCIHTFTYKEIYYKELVHVIMKAEKFYNLSSESWGPRTTGAIDQLVL